MNIPLAAGAMAADSLTVKVVDDRGRGVPRVGVTWRGDPSGYATVSPGTSTTDGDGVARAALLASTRPGPAQVSARITVDGEPSVLTFNVTVSPAPLATFTINPSPLAMAVGVSRQFSVFATDAFGNPLSNAGVQWTSSAGDVLEVGAGGTVTSKALGSAVITATLGGITRTVNVYVVPSTIAVCETGTAEVCGAWTWQGSHYAGQWQDGATASISVLRFTAGEAQFARTDDGRNPGLTAVYTGTVAGHTARGAVTWSAADFSRTGSWRAEW
ncbi:MAG TPA: Ig-like domain-containing protein [Longimicrobium sp.]|nr:Ig-like domain-containing protein [Longimicrobium sp.]